MVVHARNFVIVFNLTVQKLTVCNQLIQALLWIHLLFFLMSECVAFSVIIIALSIRIFVSPLLLFLWKHKSHIELGRNFTLQVDAIGGFLLPLEEEGLAAWKSHQNMCLVTISFNRVFDHFE